MNWAADPEERVRRDRIRIKLFTTMLATYGYAVLAGSFWGPLTSGTFQFSNLGLAVFGIVMHLLALYIALRGEP